MTGLKTCPTCGSRKLRQVREDVALSVKGRRKTVPDVTFLRCESCGEELFDLDASRKIDRATLASSSHRRRVRKTA